MTCKLASKQTTDQWSHFERFIIIRFSLGGETGKQPMEPAIERSILSCKKASKQASDRWSHVERSINIRFSLGGQTGKRLMEPR